MDGYLRLLLGCNCWYCSIKRGWYSLLDLELMLREIRQLRCMRKEVRRA
jgi:hypothetical protein